jgi:hypothetical protein
MSLEEAEFLSSITYFIGFLLSILYRSLYDAGLMFKFWMNVISVWILRTYVVSIAAGWDWHLAVFSYVDFGINDIKLWGLLP